MRALTAQKAWHPPRPSWAGSCHWQRGPLPLAVHTAAGSKSRPQLWAPTGASDAGWKSRAQSGCADGSMRRNSHAYRGEHRGTTAALGHASPAPASGEGLVTFEEVQAAAHARGLTITLKDLGPFYRITCREAGTAGAADGRVLAVTSGFVVPPLGLMHCDTLQVFTRGLKGEEGERIRGGVLGLGLLMGGAVFSYGAALGCRKAEILAINDDDAWHARLVRYYSFFGFKPVVVVEGGRLSDLPHMLVWGGAGTRMDADVRAMLRKWTPSLRRAAARAGAQSTGGSQGHTDGTGSDRRSREAVTSGGSNSNSSSTGGGLPADR